MDFISVSRRGSGGAYPQGQGRRVGGKTRFGRHWELRRERNRDTDRARRVYEQAYIASRRRAAHLKNPLMLNRCTTLQEFTEVSESLKEEFTSQLVVQLFQRVHSKLFPMDREKFFKSEEYERSVLPALKRVVANGELTRDQLVGLLQNLVVNNGNLHCDTAKCVLEGLETRIRGEEYKENIQLFRRMVEHGICLPDFYHLFDRVLSEQSVGDNPRSILNLLELFVRARFNPKNLLKTTLNQMQEGLVFQPLDMMALIKVLENLKWHDPNISTVLAECTVRDIIHYDAHPLAEVLRYITSKSNVDSERVEEGELRDKYPVFKEVAWSLGGFLKHVSSVDLANIARSFSRFHNAAPFFTGAATREAIKEKFAPFMKELAAVIVSRSADAPNRDICKALHAVSDYGVITRDSLGDLWKGLSSRYASIWLKDWCKLVFVAGLSGSAPDGFLEALQKGVLGKVNRLSNGEVNLLSSGLKMLQAFDCHELVSELREDAEKRLPHMSQKAASHHMADLAALETTDANLERRTTDLLRRFDTLQNNKLIAEMSKLHAKLRVYNAEWFDRVKSLDTRSWPPNYLVGLVYSFTDLGECHSPTVRKLFRQLLSIDPLPLHLFGPLLWSLSIFRAQTRSREFDREVLGILERLSKSDQLASLADNSMRSVAQAALIFEAHTDVYTPISDELKKRPSPVSRPSNSERKLAMHLPMYERNRLIHNILAPDFFLQSSRGYRDVAVEYDGPYHFRKNDGRPMGSLILRDEIYRRFSGSMRLVKIHYRERRLGQKSVDDRALLKRKGLI